MKSVMQEASSLIKAIEQGWIKAGQPQEFSIKILEEPQKNFIGMTIRSAKIALFFDEKPLGKAVEQAHKARPQNGQREYERPKPVQRQQPPKEMPEAKIEIKVAQEGSVEEQQAQKTRAQKPTQQRQLPILWTESMVHQAQAWLSETLANMNLGHITFTIEPQQFYLRITLSDHLLQDRDKEKQLLASFATLLLETLKHAFKTGLRGHKIVLTHADGLYHDTTHPR